MCIRCKIRIYNCKQINVLKRLKPFDPKLMARVLQLFGRASTICPISLAAMAESCYVVRVAFSVSLSLLIDTSAVALHTANLCIAPRNFA